ncbi:DeoR/GlpR transcriptional regulator [Pseudomaricurvus alkylphenolicus]|uniref:DeoR/GlpR family DNA-binding transcription regulator n=1 Tax=Pseudomaricurvus alkylphenolicus TaxID=1306991 RepID=UPI0014225075|nr:DeoR/GlpR family DNA-binding transcription regulator [Pseudomaricurvus alkylphenolicus]NIB43414.1 DeoR/GlpR transcriptional regulator [Pseudomaricurvus alkylphenolicus]
MLEKQRQRLILDILDEQQFASVRSLSTQLNSSEATIRRDLIKMSRAKQLRKIRGGAEALPNTEHKAKRQHLSGSAFLADKEVQTDVKRLIAQKAVELCEDGESIIINGGSSTFMMGEFLADRQLNILTNSFVLAQELSDNSNNQITLPGGEIYRKQGIILSAFESDTIQYYHGSKMFMGTPGIGDYGVMESDPLLIRAEQKLRKQADQLIILADSSKLGKRSKFIFSPLSEVDILITDSNADEAMLDLFSSHGIQVLIAEAADK